MLYNSQNRGLTRTNYANKELKQSTFVWHMLLKTDIKVDNQTNFIA